jgi:hypothetical protein
VPDDMNVFEEKTVTIKGKKFRFRELSVAENDECADSAKNPDGTINGRTMMRMMIMKSSVEPKLDSDIIAELPNRMYIRIYDVVSALNTIELGEDPEDEGKS